MTAELTYKSHILIGIRENGVMTVIADWPFRSNLRYRIALMTRATAMWALRCAHRRPSCLPGEMVPTLTLAVGSGAASEAMVSLLVIIAWCWSIDDA